MLVTVLGPIDFHLKAVKQARIAVVYAGAVLRS